MTPGGSPPSACPLTHVIFDSRRAATSLSMRCRCTAAPAAGHAVKHTCVVLADGNAKCFGRNSAGQLGQGDKKNRGDQPGTMGDNLRPVDLGARSGDLGC